MRKQSKRVSSPVSMSLQVQPFAAACGIRPFHVKSRRPFHSPATISRRRATAAASVPGNASPAPAIPRLVLQKPNDVQSLASSSIEPVRALGFRPTPELGLASLLFVLSMAFGAFVSAGLLSIPTMFAFKRLGDSADNLSKVVLKEVPGTLSSLKLSGMEINQLTEQLGNLRQKKPGGRYGKKGRSNNPVSS